MVVCVIHSIFFQTIFVDQMSSSSSLSRLIPRVVMMAADEEGESMEGEVGTQGVPLKKKQTKQKELCPKL